MSNTPIINQYYNNTSFSQEENVSLKSSFLGFGQTLAIALNLLKKRFSNLFVPVLVWQLVLFIVYMAIQLALIFGTLNSLEPGTLANLPTPIDQQTLEINPAFQTALESLIKIPAIIGYLTAMGVLFIVYVLSSTWIDFKTSLMLNDKSDKLFGSGLFIGKFWVLILFLIVQSIITNSIFDFFDIKSTPAVNLVLGLLSFVFVFVAQYIQVIAEYVNTIYLIEKCRFWKSFMTILGAIKKYLFVDFLKHLISFIFLFTTLLIGALIFSGLSFGLLFPLASATASNSGLGILLIILFAVVLFLAIVFILLLSWLAKCFVYVSYYNLRMLQLYNYSSSQSDFGEINYVDKKESAQTLEEKLIQNSSTSDVVTNPANDSSKSFVNIDAQNNLPEQQIQAMEEYNLMDVNPDAIEIKPEPTIINPHRSSIVGITNTDKSTPNTIEQNEDESKSVLSESLITPPTASQTQDDLKIIEGIGPKIEQLLNLNNINSFAQLAETSVEILNQILDKAGSRFSVHNPENWPRQAELARDGKMQELEELKAELIRGM